MAIKPIAPPNKDAKILIVSKVMLYVPVFMMEKGSKPNLPNDLIKKMLPKTPAMVFPISPKEYFLKIRPAILAPIIPTKMLIKDINVCVIG